MKMRGEPRRFSRFNVAWFVILSKKRVGSDPGAVVLVPKCV